jgi:hypothetical protein
LIEWEKREEKKSNKIRRMQEGEIKLYEMGRDREQITWRE